MSCWHECYSIWCTSSCYVTVCMWAVMLMYCMGNWQLGQALHHTWDISRQNLWAHNPNRAKYAMFLCEQWYLNQVTIFAHAMTAKLWHDWIIEIKITAKNIFSRFQLWAHKTFYEMGPRSLMLCMLCLMKYLHHFVVICFVVVMSTVQ